MYGSFQNRMMEQGTQQPPEVGDGATIVMYSDRYAGTVVCVTPRVVVVQEDKATRTDTNGMSDSQSYAYERDYEGRFFVFTLRRNGDWVEDGGDTIHGTRVRFGVRMKHHDYGF